MGHGPSHRRRVPQLRRPSHCHAVRLCRALLHRLPVLLHDAGCTDKSYPGFWADYRRLGDKRRKYKCWITPFSANPTTPPWGAGHRRGWPAGTGRLSAGSWSARPAASLATARHEPDRLHILSGVYQGFTTGDPICLVLENRDTRSGDYEACGISPAYRPRGLRRLGAQRGAQRSPGRRPIPAG